MDHWRDTAVMPHERQFSDRVTLDLIEVLHERTPVHVTNATLSVNAECRAATQIYFPYY